MWICGICGTPLIWGADFDFEDYGMEGEGVVSNYSCPNCGVTAEIYMPAEDLSIKTECDIK